MTARHSTGRHLTGHHSTGHHSTGLAFLVPGPLDQLTGGYLFDRRIVDGLRARGRAVEIVELAGSFPEPDAAACTAIGAALAALPDGAAAVIDGLALLAAADCLSAATRRLRLVAFVHHPLASETGLSATASGRIAALEATLLRQLCGAICPSDDDVRVHAGIIDSVLDQFEHTNEPPTYERRARSVRVPIRDDDVRDI